ncbi:sugar ABC transporter ATP-binding protein [Desulfosediminicola flagellatus]|uniref:sugar ABC transporter ATP-binding protein n=1 Tax=Desulfosediminicola flagellatus TaxID=2569541 RepID=UPI0010AC1642|nr:sugar ABC transporter ATP-binding protein [Desulfosediminicola flagellatus]
MDTAILQFREVTKTFPGVTALNKISFSVEKGEIHGICGENGAGKSTLMKILAGVHPRDTYTGEVIFEGEPLNFAQGAIQQAREMGIAIVHQELALVQEMTVGENIYLGREPGGKSVINWHQLYSETQQILNRYQIDLPIGKPVSTLSVGRQQMVEIVRALSEDAKILILDEPTSALADQEVKVLMQILQTLKEQGVTCLYISHKLEEVFDITDRVTVFRDGEVVGTKKTSETSTNEIIAMMVGREMTERFPVAKRSPKEVVLEVEGLSADWSDAPGKEMLSDISFSVRAGEILGIAGLMGSGRSELVTMLFGECGRIQSGTIRICGEAVKICSAREAMKHGISLIPEDRKQQGLVLGQSILKNISLANMDRFAGFGSINKHEELNASEKMAKELAVKAPTLHAIVNSLSGGNQQKVVIGKWLMSEPKVLILDEPTRGIDVGAKYEIYKLMNKLAAEGVAIIMVSSELPEILGMSDRILVMHEGRVGGIVDRENATQENLMALATGMTAGGGM